MATTLDKVAYAHFDSTVDTHFLFPRPTNRILITVVSGTVNMSLDKGENFMALAVGTHQFDISVFDLRFSGGGVFSGVGISL